MMTEVVDGTTATSQQCTDCRHPLRMSREQLISSVHVKFHCPNHGVVEEEFRTRSGHLMRWVNHLAKGTSP